jgi:hypothetical protein
VGSTSIHHRASPGLSPVRARLKELAAGVVAAHVAISRHWLLPQCLAAVSRMLGPESPYGNVSGKREACETI